MSKQLNFIDIVHAEQDIESLYTTIFGTWQPMLSKMSLQLPNSPLFLF